MEPGETSNADEQNGTPVIILAWCLFCITTIVIALRMYCRLLRARRVMANDYLVLMAWTFALLQATFLTVAWKHGLGRHFNDITPTERAKATKYTIVFAEPFAVTSSMFGRLSFCALLLALLENAYSKRRASLWTVIAIQVVINVTVIIQIWAQCGSHISALWDEAVANTAHCTQPMVQAVLGFVQGSINSLSDLFLVFMPVLILWSLQMPLSHKIGIGAMLTLSIFACVASIVKTVLLQNLARGDLTWYIGPLNLAVVVENNVVMMASSIPTLRPLLPGPKRGLVTTHPYDTGSKQARTTSYSQQPRRSDASDDIMLYPLPDNDRIQKSPTFHTTDEIST